MKAVILAGGYGTRLAEKTTSIPKPMVEIGGKPILWHIMSHLARHGISEFLIALGYKGQQIKRYFVDYHLLQSDITVDLGKGTTTWSNPRSHDWIVHLIDTGLDTHTGGRVRRLGEHLAEERFLVTYGDGVCNVDIGELVEFHKAQDRMATLTAVRPPARFGALMFDGNRVSEFTEKPQIGEGWINGGFLIMEPAALGYLTDDSTSLEADALERLAADEQLSAYRHAGFWQCMDTLRDVNLLRRLWEQGEASWLE